MFIAKITQGQAHDLAMILDQMAPAAFAEYRQYRLNSKVVDKCLKAAEEVVDLLSDLDKKLAPHREVLKSAKDEAEKKGVTSIMNEIAEPIVGKANKLRQKVAKIEFSDDEQKFLHSIFFEHIAKKMSTTKLAVAIGDAIGYTPGEEEKKS